MADAEADLAEKKEARRAIKNPLTAPATLYCMRRMGATLMTCMALAACISLSDGPLWHGVTDSNIGYWQEAFGGCTGA